MKNIICVPDKSIADKIAEECGCKYMTQPINGNQELYTFIETEKLHNYLSKSKSFSKKDWFYQNRLCF